MFNDITVCIERGRDLGGGLSGPGREALSLILGAA